MHIFIKICLIKRLEHICLAQDSVLLEEEHALFLQVNRVQGKIIQISQYHIFIV